MDEETLRNDKEVILLRLTNVYMMILLYFKSGDFERIVRYLTENTKQNLNLKELLDTFSKEPNVNRQCGMRGVDDVVCYLYQILADSLMQTQEWKRASDTYYLVCKMHNRWKHNIEE